MSSSSSGRFRTPLHDQQTVNFLLLKYFSPMSSNRSTIRVMWTASGEGEGLPDGWLCATIAEKQRTCLETS
jgi:hypothetical protein